MATDGDVASSTHTENETKRRYCFDNVERGKLAAVHLQALDMEGSSIDE